MYRYSFIILLATLILLPGCNDDRPLFDEAYVFVTDEYGAEISEVNALSSFVAAYPVSISCRPWKEDLTLSYQIVAGNGLTEGIDYKVVPATASPLTFPNGVYQLAIRIEWLRNPVDETKDNTLQIILSEVSETLHIGMPGKAKRFATHTITKTAFE